MAQRAAGGPVLGGVLVELGGRPACPASRTGRGPEPVAERVADIVGRG
jgi:hypothetical protein